jgi:hypothetical protein
MQDAIVRRSRSESVDALAAVHALVLKGWNFTINPGPEHTQTKAQNGLTSLFAMTNKQGVTSVLPARPQ